MISEASLSSRSRRSCIATTRAAISFGSASIVIVIRSSFLTLNWESGALPSRCLRAIIRREGGVILKKSEYSAQLAQLVENYRKDMALFEDDSTQPATVADLSRLSTMTFYAISELAKIIEEALD